MEKYTATVTPDDGEAPRGPGVFPRESQLRRLGKFAHAYTSVSDSHARPGWAYLISQHSQRLSSPRSSGCTSARDP